MAGDRGKALARGGPARRQVVEAIIAQTSLGIWVLDSQDRTTFVNERMAEIVGARPEEMLGEPVYDFLDPRSAEATRVALRRRRTGIAELREVELHRRDGTVIETIVESIPLTGADGGYDGSVA